ncbi:ABC transporter permease [Selenomonas sp. AE3005]|uniref:ABC transporter permease n=1 Tax=Selenomonas sp. AE3005 TaxID=1485543 RepID=UPI0025CC130A|nr:ABC transporter permease [Selenomonas sp. AE3005]
MIKNHKPIGGQAGMNYAIRRFLQLIPILFGITFLSFLLMYLAGSDAVTEMYSNRGVEAAQEIIDERKAALGLNLPFFQQYLNWLGAMLQGNMGISYVTGEDVLTAFMRKLPATLLLTGSAVAVTVLISLPCGILAAVRHDRLVDLLLRFGSFLGNAMPNFFVAMLLMEFLGIQLGILPVIASGTDIESAIMPTLTLAIAMSAKYLRQVRSAVLEELNKEYVQGARARGVSESVILWKNVMKAAMLTIMTLLALSIGSLLGGTAIIESIFMWDGVGKLAVDAINMRDYPLIQAYVMWMAIIYVFVNLTADLLYHYFDPRIRLGGSAK